MGIGDFVEKAKGLAGKNKEKVKEGIDKSGDLVDEKTASTPITSTKGQDAAEVFVEELPEND